MPTSVNEAARVLAWLSSILGARTEAPGGFWSGVAPLDIEAVFYGCTMSPVDDLAGVGAHRIWHEGIYTIKAIGPVRGAGDYTKVIAAADYLDNRLQLAGSEAASVDCTILSCVRLRPVIYDEPPSDGVIWSHLGADWQIRAQRTGS
jgi:hypothetical protein